MPLIPNYEYLKESECDEAITEKNRLRNLSFFQKLLFTRGLPIGRTAPRQQQEKRTAEGDCGDFVSS